MVCTMYTFFFCICLKSSLFPSNIHYNFACWLTALTNAGIHTVDAHWKTNLTSQHFLCLYSQTFLLAVPYHSDNAFVDINYSFGLSSIYWYSGIVVWGNHFQALYSLVILFVISNITGSNCCIIYAESKVLTALMVCYHFIFLQVALILFSSLTETIGATFQSHLNNLQPILLKCLQDGTSSRVRIAALKYG